MDSINVRVAKRLLEIKAVFLRPQEPFTWASGIKSPIYCDNRLILTAPEARNEVEQAIADTVKREYPEAEVLMGTATAGIAHAAIAAHLLGLPMGYVRSGNKDHGRQNRIEGRLDKGEKVVVVEDLISTGGSVLETVEALREAGAEVLGVVSIFTYGMKKGIERMAAAGVKNVSLSNLDTIAQVGAEEGYISQDDVARLEKELAALREQQTPEVSREELEALRGENTRLKAQIEELEAQLTEPEAPVGDQTNWKDEELAAYRRAETVERQARNRAAQMYHRVNGLIADLAARMEGSKAEMTTAAEALGQALDQLQSALDGGQDVLTEGAATLRALEPEHPAEEETK